ncbi:MAG: nitroreductase family protein [Coriobacteriaceae bacterium]
MELIVVRDRAMLDELAECREQGAGMLTGADAAIVVVADPTLADTWVEDCSIVMANMQLEAAASGVGSCWIQGRLRQAADGRSTHEFVANLLKVPAPYQLEAILSLGMPGAEAPRRPFDEALLEGAQGDVLEIQFHSLPAKIGGLVPQRNGRWRDRRFGTA